MKNKNGFTLVELLGVVVIIGVLSIISVPTVEKSIKDSKNQAYNRIIDSIKMAMTQWKQNHPEYFEYNDNTFFRNNNVVIYLSVAELKVDGLLDNTVVDPRNDSMIPNDMQLKIYKDEDGFHYDVDELSGTKTDKYNFVTPYLKLEHGKIRYFDINSVYDKDNVILYDINGQSVDANVQVVKKELNGQSTTIDTSTPGIYYLKYSLISNLIPISYYQTIIVSDMTAPVISFDSNNIEVTDGFDFKQGVTVIDNVDGDLSSIVQVDVPEYVNDGSNFIVTYTATDSNGNVSKKQRTFYTHGEIRVS